MKKKKKIRLNRNGRILAFSICVFALLLISCSVFGFLTKPVSSDDTNIPIIIEAGDTYSSIGAFLEKQNLIRSKFAYKIYIKVKKPTSSLKAGRHFLKRNMTLQQIIHELQQSPANDDTISVTFKEGLNIRQMADIIEEKTNNTANDFYQALTNETYLDQLIAKYWFLSNEIKQKDIYYSLEGYLYPNTYQFAAEASVSDIIEKMLDEMERQLTPYKTSLTSGMNQYSIHQIMTIASLSELEAVSKSDREQVARVFYNRLAEKMTLGSDVTTYYAAKINIGERDLYQSELDAVNAYNTRSVAMAGKLPVGPICNPSIDAIATAIDPEANDYYYFVADKNRKVYFTRNSSEHSAIIKKLQEEGLWYTFE